MMIVNPFLSVAVVANAATVLFSRMPSSDYFTEIENYDGGVHRRKRERADIGIGEFVVRPASAITVPPCEGADDAKGNAANEGAASASASTATEPPPPPPPLPDTNSPFLLLGLDPGADFEDVRRTYRDMARTYHPDGRRLGPASSPEERRSASWDFARVNAAYDILKRSNDEEGREAVKATSLGAEHHDDARDRFPVGEGDSDLAVRDSIGRGRRHERRPKRTTWRERDASDSSSFLWGGGGGRGGFDADYVVSGQSPGKWRTGAHVLKREDHDWQVPREHAFASGPENEKRKGERQRQRRQRRRTHPASGLGVVDPRPGRWRNDEPPAAGDRGDGPSPDDDRECSAREEDGRRFPNAKRKQGFPHKGSLGYGTRPTGLWEGSGTNSGRVIGEEGFGTGLGP